MQKKNRFRTHPYLPYIIMLWVNLSFIIAAFIVDTPASILSGIFSIITSRSILLTDFLVIGGVGATLLNVAIVGLFALAMLTGSRIKPSGAIIMALWLTAGFAFFGKNLFNMIPLTAGVWAFSKYKKEPFSNYVLASLLVATLSPVVSEISFLGTLSIYVEIVLGIVLGFVIGFIFPPISSHMVRVHGGYDLYSMGFAGGLIATIITTTTYSMGYDLPPERHISEGNNTVLAIILYTFSVALILCGLFTGSNESITENVKKNVKEFLKFHKHSGRLITDFYFLYGNSIYLNMGILCIFATTLVLLLGAQLGGIIVAGIFTMVGFACFGKHMLNILPVIAGAVLSAVLNKFEFTSAENIAAILFSSALAPIAGQFGPHWGIAAGFLHVSVAMHVGGLNGGLNLYNNGFAAGIVAMFMLPVITASGRIKRENED